MHKGSCICQKVSFEIEGDIKPMDACHCKICRKASGHFGVGTDIDREKIKILGEENIQWFQSSDWVRRGFCKTCGCHMFFDPLDKEKVGWIGLYAGTIDGQTNAKIREHIYVKDKGDYYEIDDGLPQFETHP